MTASRIFGSSGTAGRTVGPRRLWLAACAVLALAAGATPAHAVTVTPSALYVDHRTRTTTLTLYNQGSLPEEIDISFAFGYPQNDAAGNVVVPLVSADSAAPGEPSAAGWIRAFPRRVRLQPGERQVIRVLVQPPVDLADGEYWARVLVTSTGGEPPVEQSLGGGVNMSIHTKTVIVTSLSYRKGGVSTGVAVNAASARPSGSGDGVALTLDLERSGNAAFLGRIQAELLAPDGRVLARAEDAVAVYRRLTRALHIPYPGGPAPPGSTVRYLIDTERPDLPPDGPIPTPTRRGTAPVR